MKNKTWNKTSKNKSPPKKKTKRQVSLAKSRLNSVCVTFLWFRYETCWMPLMAQHGKKEKWKLRPPDDIWWIWHVHMLAPVHYDADCKAIVGEWGFSSWASCEQSSLSHHAVTCRGRHCNRDQPFPSQSHVTSQKHQIERRCLNQMTTNLLAKRTKDHWMCGQSWFQCKQGYAHRVSLLLPWPQHKLCAPKPNSRNSHFIWNRGALFHLSSFCSKIMKPRTENTQHGVWSAVLFSPWGNPDLPLTPKSGSVPVSVQFLRALGSQSGVSVWQHILVG